MHLKYNNMDDEDLELFFGWDYIEEVTDTTALPLPTPTMQIQDDGNNKTDIWSQLWKEKYEEKKYDVGLISLPLVFFS